MVDIVKLFQRIYNKIYVPKYKKRMGACGERVFFSPFNSTFLYENMYVGNDVHIGYHADMVASRSKIIIGNHVVLIVLWFMKWERRVSHSIHPHFLIFRNNVNV